MMMENSSAAVAAAAAGGDHRLDFLKISGSNPDGSGYHYFRGMSSKNSKIIKLPSFDSTMGGCCVGLLHLDDCEGQAVIFNPITDEFKFLPPSTVQRPSRTNYDNCLACGFGFDPLSNDYKVIRFVNNCCEIFDEDGYAGVDILELQVEIYSLKSNTWKQNFSFPNCGEHVFKSGTYVDSKCYWILSKRLSVLWFDFEKESFSSIPLPKIKEGSDCLLDLHEYKGSLVVIGYERSGLNRCFEAWKLLKREDEEEVMWEKLFDVRVPGSACKTLGFGKDGGSLFLEGEDQQLIEYDLFHGNLKELRLVQDEYCMEIISYSVVDPTVSLPDAEIANPIKEGVEIKKGVEIFSCTARDEDYHGLLFLKICRCNGYHYLRGCRKTQKL